MNLERIQAIYSELGKYEVQLHPDPRTLGPVYLNDLIAKTRNYLNMVSRIQLEVHQQKQTLARDLRAHEAVYQISSDDLLANDERVRRLPSIEDRKATVAVFLRNDRQIIERLKADFQDIEYVDKAVRHRHKELTSTMSEIKLQRSLIRDEIDTGAMYGDERTYTTSKKVSRIVAPIFGDDLSEEDLERLLTGSKEQAEATPDEATIAEVTVVESSPEDPIEEAVSAFLGTPESVGLQEDDFSDVFKNL